MTGAASLVAQLAAAGTPPELLAAVAEQLFAGEMSAKAIEERRAHDRERSARRRSRDVTGDDVTTGDVTGGTPSPLAPPKKDPEPQKTTPPISPNPDYLRGKNLPEGLPAEPWLAFVRSRKAIPKVPFTEDAARGAARKTLKLVGEGYDAAKLLWMAVDKGWRTVFPNDDCKATSLRGNLTPDQLEDRARFFESVGKADEANDCRSRAEELRKLAA